MEDRAGLFSAPQLLPGIRLVPGAAAGAGGKEQGDTRRDACHDRLCGALDELPEARVAPQRVEVRVNPEPGG